MCILWGCFFGRKISCLVPRSSGNFNSTQSPSRSRGINSKSLLEKWPPNIAARDPKQCYIESANARTLEHTHESTHKRARVWGPLIDRSHESWTIQKTTHMWAKTNVNKHMRALIWEHKCERAQTWEHTLRTGGRQPTHFTTNMTCTELAVDSRPPRNTAVSGVHRLKGLEKFC